MVTGSGRWARTAGGGAGFTSWRTFGSGVFVRFKLELDVDVDANGRAFWRRCGESEAVLVRVEELDEGRVLVEALFLVEVEEVREGTGAWVGGCEVEGSLVLGAGLAAASASSFSKAFIFRVSESTWKLSFLRSLRTLE
jgi:hypothetical protein